eukprot:3389677-Rhodomonas_salina.1
MKRIRQELRTIWMLSADPFGVSPRASQLPARCSMSDACDGNEATISAPQLNAWTALNLCELQNTPQIRDTRAEFGCYARFRRHLLRCDAKVPEQYAICHSEKLGCTDNSGKSVQSVRVRNDRWDICATIKGLPKEANFLILADSERKCCLQEGQTQELVPHVTTN